MCLRQCAAAAVLLVLALLAGCRTQQAPVAQCPPAPVCPPCPGAEAPPAPPAAPLQRAQWTDLPGWSDDDAGAALVAFRAGCPALANKPEWVAVCREAETVAPGAGAARAFFQARFAPYRAVNPDGGDRGLITGYYEPLLQGRRTRAPGFEQPVLSVPEDLLVVDLGELYPELKGYRLRGRLDGRIVRPYFAAGEIRDRAEALPAKPLAWVADPVELLFLQVQGSGRIDLPDGTRLRVGYADQNGHPYRSIGRWLVEQGELTLDQASAEGIKAWARANPARVPELIAANPSYVFFRPLPGAAGGPIGALGVPLTAGRSIAVDRGHTPLGAPVYLDTTEPLSERPLRRLMMAQDTGGAIRGPVRADYFWGFGKEAGVQAGRMRQQGRMWVLLPPALAPKDAAGAP